ncbi:MAG TPA: response regulator transcription factor [Thermoanaerobaculia bacterium]
MPRILVVDDDRLIRTLLTSIFEMHGVECVTAGDGEEALRRLGDGRFDLMLLDLMMPGLDGFGVLEALARTGRPHPPIMIATAASASVIERIRPFRIAAILAKPFDVDELVGTARELLRHEQLARSMRIVRIEPRAAELPRFRRLRMPFG